MYKLKFELNLLENSYDYVRSSFELYLIANEYGIHDEQKSEIDNKVKWKLAFITMIQATELLLKEILYRIHPNLIYDNIDCEKMVNMKTVSFQQALNRIGNFCDKSIDNEEKIFLINCLKLRNEFVHYKVSIQSENIKPKYCKLFSIYKKLHSKFIGDRIIYNSREFFKIEENIIEFNENLTIFRGREILHVYLETMKKEIVENSKYEYYITYNGQKVKRIRYGSEKQKLHEILKDTHNNNFSLYDDYEVCDECLAKQGEFHREGCDLEVCPVCGGQIISCGCIDKDENGHFKKYRLNII